VEKLDQVFEERSPKAGYGTNEQTPHTDVYGSSYLLRLGKSNRVIQLIVGILSLLHNALSIAGHPQKVKAICKFSLHPRAVTLNVHIKTEEE
jgi:hypothetical protein